MNAPARDRGDPGLSERVAALESDVELLFALVSAATARLSEPEGSPASIDNAQITTLKGAAFLSGFSQSWVRKAIKSGAISAQRVGGRILVDKRTVPQRSAKR